MNDTDSKSNKTGNQLIFFKMRIKNTCQLMEEKKRKKEKQNSVILPSRCSTEIPKR